jgi:hypothetical protein
VISTDLWTQSLISGVPSFQAPQRMFLAVGKDHQMPRYFSGSVQTYVVEKSSAHLKSANMGQ